MAKPKLELLERGVTYSGEGISVRSLEGSIHTERSRQNVQVGELERLRKRNVELQKSLTDEVAKLRKLSDYVSTGKLGGGLWANFKEILSFIPGLGKLSITQRSIEELLRQQYEISSLRVKEAAEYADRLQAAETDLYDEVERLNAKIVESAENEEVAAEYVLELKALQTELSAARDAAGQGSAEARKLTADFDRTKRLLAEHSTQLKLYHTAEERLARLKEATGQLVETIANLRTDIVQYVTAASEKLDLVSGQIRAIGTAADASVVMLEMKKSLDSMTESLNDTTRFVSETQLYFRENLDRLLDDLEVYDDRTRAVLDENLAKSKESEERRIAEAVEVALAQRADKQE